MSHSIRFREIVLGAITDFLSEFQTGSFETVCIQDIIGPSVIALHDAECNRDDITAELCHRFITYYKQQMSLTVRYKILTILFPVCRTFVDTVYYSLHDCKACGNSGWWCRGCGSSNKLDAMNDAGIQNADEIRNYQFAGCDEPLVPCFLCNKNGDRPNDDEGMDIDPNFWDTFE